MCLYPKLIRNKKYMSNKKNGGIVPTLHDGRMAMVPIGCGKCIECMKRKANDWRVRLHEELKHDNTGIFVTLTFSNDSITKLGCNTENETATKAVRLFLERWRKKYKKSLKHWLITELGGETDRIHLHGILFTKELQSIDKIWSYGFTYTGSFVNERTVNYIVKYVTKIDIKHKDFTGKILCSPGIGGKFKSQYNKFDNEATNELYITRQGTKFALPIYYRNKLYSESEKEKLWAFKLNKQVRFIEGIKIDISTEEGMKRYWDLLKTARNKNFKLGYGKAENWSKIIYEKCLDKLK